MAPSAAGRGSADGQAPSAAARLRQVSVGDIVDFVLVPDGTVTVRAGRYDAADLRGFLRKPGRRPVSLQPMSEALETARARKPSPGFNAHVFVRSATFGRRLRGAAGFQLT